VWGGDEPSLPLVLGGGGSSPHLHMLVDLLGLVMVYHRDHGQWGLLTMVATATWWWGEVSWTVVVVENRGR